MGNGIKIEVFIQLQKLSKYTKTKGKITFHHFNRVLKFVIIKSYCARKMIYLASHFSLEDLSANSAITTNVRILWLQDFMVLLEKRLAARLSTRRRLRV